MPPQVLDFLGPFLAITTSCVVILTGMKIYLNYRRDVQINKNSRDETKNLVEDLSRLQDEVLLLRDGLEDVNERLEFHERLLTRATEEKVDTPA
ncbi:MAG: hypothetical protein JSW71_21845 [Gemmatimonadota bacterium]|nr:MAG: hypothetical protein JSW71_21845 [Gemmatimonadota bacterium]